MHLFVARRDGVAHPPFSLAQPPTPYPPDHRDKGASPPSLRGPLAQPTSGGNEGASPVAQAASLSAHRGAQSAFAATSSMVLRAGEPPRSPGSRPGHKAFSWGRGITITPSPLRQPPAMWGKRWGRKCLRAPSPSSIRRRRHRRGPRGDRGGGTRPPQVGQGRRLRHTRGAARRRSWRMGGPVMRLPDPGHPVLPSRRDTKGWAGGGGPVLPAPDP